MRSKSPLKAINYTIALLLILTGTTFSALTKTILPFMLGFVGAGLIITIYRNLTWDFKQRLSFFKNSLEKIKEIECENCGSLNPWWSTYCTQCGEKVPKDKIKCPECDTLNPPRSSYCGECGNPIKLGTEKQQKMKNEENNQSKKQEENEETYIKCRSCGHKFDPGLRRCPWCGSFREN
ncbi:MAG: XerD/XerC family integrase [Candidatus Methanohalarchaeum thermophilum]|uniref:XerD/XerC family integrase n=1 Tax=Methanohalarchaeum thermophilum TaxID=1903181 RepID=A0A1Q6DVS3_METT1|nr:MAG: XerD/XerC family integrase [Candidatus Methanohalarchaeum thermophilum]